MRPNLSKTLGVFFGILSVLSLITVFLLPKLLFSLYKIESMQKSLLDINNYDLWAFFPGKLETKIQHDFNLYDLKSVSKDEANITTYNFSYSNDSIVFNENITYSNFSFTDKTNEVTFLANSIFSLNETSKNSNLNEDPNLGINTISYGMIELIHTLTSPPNYQILMNSLKIVSTNILDSNRFIRKLFTLFAYDRIFQNKAMVKKTILSRFNDDLAELLYSGDNSYSMGSINGLYEWSLLIDDQDMRAKAEWLKNNFKLSSVDINNIIGNQSFLSRFYQYFLNYLKFTFKCYDDKDCLNQLVFKQLFDGSVTKQLNIENIQDLYLKINSTYYPFLSTPEMKNYYEGDFKKKMRDSNVTRFENITFENMGIDMDIVKSLISGQNTTLLKSENAIDFVFFNYTKNLYSSYLKFNIQTLDQLFFFSDYFMNFLPSIYLYPAFQVQKGNETSTYYGNKLSNALVSLIPIAVNQSIEKIKNNIESVLISRITYHKLKSEENIIDCRGIFKTVTHNNLEKVEKICSNPQLNLDNYKSIKRWVYISDCIYSYCKEEEKQQLKALSGLNDAELGELFRLSNLGKYINTATQIMRNNYDIGNDIYEKASNQFFFSSITLNVPQFMLEIKSITLHDFDDDVFPYPLEIKNYINYNGDYNDIKIMLTRIFNDQIKSGEKIYNQESAFAQKINLIITFTKYFVKIDNTASDYIKMIKNTLFNKIDQVYTKNNLIFGSSDPYIDILKKGDFYENFKPNKSKFTGIPLKLNFDGQKKINNNNQKARLLHEFKKGKKTDIKGQFDRVNEYTMFTGRFSINNLNLRTISKINNEKIFNFKKAIFTNEGKEIYYRVPILKGKSLIEASDGFQYSAEKNVIYYYDKFTSNVLSFEFKSTNKFSNINCDFYQLANTIETPLTEKDIGKSNILKNLKNIIGNAFDTFDRPTVIARTDNIIKNLENSAYSKIIVSYDKNNEYNVFSKDFEKTNYICVDQFSEFVIASNIRITYSFLLKDYDNFNDLFSKEVLIPLFDYNRKMSLTEESYTRVFPRNVGFQSLNNTIKILGMVVVVIFIILSIAFIIRYKNEAKLEKNSYDKGILLN